MEALMANWAWPHTPDSRMARLLLSGGPFDGEQVGFLPPDTANPAQIIWTGWFPWGFTAYLYEWRGKVQMDRGRTDALIYEIPTWQADDMRVGRGRRITAEEVPPVVEESAELWADTAARLSEAFGLIDVPAELIWPGL